MKKDYTYATDEEILTKVSRVDVTYVDNVKVHFDAPTWVGLRAGIINNLLLKGLCHIRFREKRGG
jgi:hypothetical protein